MDSTRKGDKNSRRDGRDSVSRQLSREDVANQGRRLAEIFVVDRLALEHIENPLILTDLHEPGTPPGPALQNTDRLVKCLREIADQFDKDTNIAELVRRVPDRAEKDSFFKVVRELFRDGYLNWGRIVALFYLAYRLIRKVLNQIPLVREILNWITNFIRENVAEWIINRGGWVQKTFVCQSFQLCLTPSSNYMAQFQKCEGMYF